MHWASFVGRGPGLLVTKHDNLHQEGDPLRQVLVLEPDPAVRRWPGECSGALGARVQATGLRSKGPGSQPSE